MRSKIPTCQRLTGYCYNAPNRFTCVPATLSCWQIAGPIQQSGLNPYGSFLPSFLDQRDPDTGMASDVRKKCDREGDE